MPTGPLVIPSLVLLVTLAIPALVYWSVVLSRVLTGIRTRSTIRAGLGMPPPPGGWPALSVIVPAHNEERVIDACARSLRGQDYENLEIIFVLDRCTDRTGELLVRHAEDPRIRIVVNDDCPGDWAGKCNAARRGADVARGQWLLFTDADTDFEPGLCRASVALALARGADMVSLLSTLTAGHAFERIAQPVACWVLLKIFPVTRSHRDRRPRSFANGQFMLFRRGWYDSVGGHEAVRQDLLEDLAFARALHRTGGHAEVMLADGMLRCSMYDSLEAFLTGWRRIFIDACGRRPSRLRKYGWRTIGSGAAVPLLQLAGIAIGAWAALTGAALAGVPLVVTILAAWVAQAMVLTTVYRAVGAPAWAAAFFPLGSLLVGRGLLRAARELRGRTPIFWGGRSYVLEPREGSNAPWVVHFVEPEEDEQGGERAAGTTTREHVLAGQSVTEVPERA